MKGTGCVHGTPPAKDFHFKLLNLHLGRQNQPNMIDTSKAKSKQRTVENL